MNEIQNLEVGMRNIRFSRGRRKAMMIKYYNILFSLAWEKMCVRS